MLDRWFFVACTTKPGEFERELGPVQFYREDGSSFLIAPATVVDLGLVDRLELVAATNILSWQARCG